MKVSESLNACTKFLKPVAIKPNEGPFEGRRLIIVDTPAFNSTITPDIAILHRIADWLATS